MRRTAFDSILRRLSLAIIIVFGAMLAFDLITAPDAPDGDSIPLPQDMQVVCRFSDHVKPHMWRSIIVHHSGTLGSSVKQIRAGFIEMGCEDAACHFFVQPDGQISATTYWQRQQWCDQTSDSDNEFDEAAVGIYVVGNFTAEAQPPSAAQLQGAAQLINYLSETYQIKKHYIWRRYDIDRTPNPGSGLNWRRFLRSLN